MRKVNISKEELEMMILSEKSSYEEIGRKLSISGSHVRKLAKKLNISLPRRRSINSSENFNKGKNLSKDVIYLKSVSDKKFLEVIKTSKHISDIIESFGCENKSSVRRYIRTRSTSLDI